MNHRTYLTLAIPLIISTITTPLLGAVDTAVVGQLPDPSYIAAVAIGTIIFNTIYWLFGFLRVSTSGFAAQANGANDEMQGILALSRPFLIAIVVGLCFFMLQWPVEHLFLTMINPDAAVRSLASDYFSIRIWGVPFALMNYVILGWLMGMSKIKASLLLQVCMNLLNIILDLVFVHVLSWAVSGVALATLIAEVSAFFIGLIIIRKAAPYKLTLPTFKIIANLTSLKKMMAVNLNLFIRTICLLTVLNVFTAQGASFGTETLAANAVLIQIQFLMAYFFDGFANASSIYVGKAVGAKDKQLYQRTLWLSWQWAIISALFVTLIYYLYGPFFIKLFTSIPSVIELANTFDFWLNLFPITASFGFILYGVFTGSTMTAPIRNSIIYALIVFFIVLVSSLQSLHNHGLWLAFILFSLGRSLFLALYIPKLNRELFPSEGKKLVEVIEKQA